MELMLKQLMWVIIIAVIINHADAIPEMTEVQMK